MAKKSTLSVLVLAIITAFSSAIRATREDTEAQTTNKTEADAKIAELEAALHKAKADDEEVAELKTALEEALTLAAASRPPTDEQLAQIEKLFSGDESDGEGEPTPTTDPA